MIRGVDDDDPSIVELDVGRYEVAVHHRTGHASFGQLLGQPFGEVCLAKAAGTRDDAATHPFPSPDMLGERSVERTVLNHGRFQQVPERGDEPRPFGPDSVAV